MNGDFKKVVVGRQAAEFAASAKVRRGEVVSARTRDTSQGVFPPGVGGLASGLNQGSWFGFGFGAYSWF